jgi:hypothetical protein
MQVGAISSSLPVFPFHHITHVQMQTNHLRLSMQDGVLPQVELHLKGASANPIMSKADMQNVLDKWLKAPEILRTKTGNIIDIVH